mmetsp:Transcript_11737/g.16836  ORF Transcript_11737/g.16836 Transcript_11737/m.16836 type:complete len:101 (-) Transcript_11737:430-732(-)
MLTVGFGRGSVCVVVVWPHHTAPAIIFFSRRRAVVVMVTSTVNARLVSSSLRDDTKYMWECFGANIPSVGACIHAELDNLRSVLFSGHNNNRRSSMKEMI